MEAVLKTDVAACLFLIRPDMTTHQPIQHDVVDDKYSADVKHADSVEDARDTDSETKDNAVRPGWVDVDDGFDPKMIKRLVRKIDFHVIPILALMYCISLIDRTNLSMARAANNKAMNTELGLDVGNRYSLATMIFFIPYIVLEIPVSTEFIEALNPRRTPLTASPRSACAPSVPRSGSRSPASSGAS